MILFVAEDKSKFCHVCQLFIFVCFVVVVVEIGDTLIARPEFCTSDCHSYKTHSICAQTKPASLPMEQFHFTKSSYNYLKFAMGIYFVF